MSRENPLQEGDIIELKAGHQVYIDLPRHFVYGNCVGEFKRLATAAVKVGQTFGGMETGWLAGRYVVVSTSMEGGGTGHGPHDIYPDGHRVWAERIPEKGVLGTSVERPYRVNFYETGCFTAMNGDIEPVGKAKKSWTVDSDKE